MESQNPDNIRAEHQVLVLDTIRRYVEGGHQLSIDTSIEPGQVEVRLGFEPEAFAEYFQRLGGGLVTEA